MNSLEANRPVVKEKLLPEEEKLVKEIQWIQNLDYQPETKLSEVEAERARAESFRLQKETADFEQYELVAGVEGLKIGFLADIHSNFTALEKTVERFNEEKVELVVLGGDYLNTLMAEILHKKRDLTRLTEVLMRLKRPKYGVVAVLGNHDVLGIAPPLHLQTKKEGLVRTALEKAGVIVLEDGKIDLGKIKIEGRSEQWKKTLVENQGRVLMNGLLGEREAEMDEEIEEKREEDEVDQMAGSRNGEGKKEGLIIIAAHNPLSIQEEPPSEKGPILVLLGHTHGVHDWPEKMRAMADEAASGGLPRFDSDLGRSSWSKIRDWSTKLTRAGFYRAVVDDQEREVLIYITSGLAEKKASGKIGRDEKKEREELASLPTAAVLTVRGAKTEELGGQNEELRVATEIKGEENEKKDDQNNSRWKNKKREWGRRATEKTLQLHMKRNRGLDEAERRVGLREELKSESEKWRRRVEMTRLGEKVSQRLRGERILEKE